MREVKETMSLLTPVSLLQTKLRAFTKITPSNLYQATGEPIRSEQASFQQAYRTPAEAD